MLQDRQGGMTDVIVEPTTASRPEALQAKTTFRQDRMYFLSPFKIGCFGIPSRLRLEEEDQGHYKYSLATTIGGDQSWDPGRTLSLHSHKNKAPEVVLPLY